MTLKRFCSILSWWVQSPHSYISLRGEAMQRRTTVTVDRPVQSSHRTQFVIVPCVGILCLGHLYLGLDGPVACPEHHPKCRVFSYTIKPTAISHSLLSGLPSLTDTFTIFPSQSDSFLLMFCNVAMSRHTMVSLIHASENTFAVSKLRHFIRKMLQTPSLKTLCLAKFSFEKWLLGCTVRCLGVCSP